MAPFLDWMKQAIPEAEIEGNVVRIPSRFRSLDEDRVKDALSYALRFLLTDDWPKCQHDIAECVREQVPELRQCSDETIVTKDTVRAFLLNPKSGSANPQDWTNW